MRRMEVARLYEPRSFPRLSESGEIEELEHNQISGSESRNTIHCSESGATSVTFELIATFEHKTL